MGLCPSRNTKSIQSKAATESLVPPPRPAFQLRPDAAAFTPKAAPAPKEEWEHFLDEKQRQQLTTFSRKKDGTFTADYVRLLGKQKPKYAARSEPKPQQDLIQEWKEGLLPPQKREPPREKQPRARKQATGSDAVLRAALAKVQELPRSRSAVLEQLSSVEVCKDDAGAGPRPTPFGLTDAHYLSDCADDYKSHSHVLKVHTTPRPYAVAARPITPEAEAAMTELLYSLRCLRRAETQAELDAPRRYCVGLREVARSLKSAGSLKAVLVAPDVEAGAGGALDSKLQDLVAKAKEQGVPVVYGLSRTRLGQAIKKNVTISVLGVLETRGMQEQFDALVRIAQAPPGL